MTVTAGSEPGTPLGTPTGSAPEEAVERLRLDLGVELADRRSAAGLTQRELADRIAFSRSHVASAEAARSSLPGRDFWRRCDDVLGTGGRLATAHRRVLDARAAVLERRRHAVARERAARLEMRHLPDADPTVPETSLGDTEDVRRRDMLQLIGMVAATGALPDALGLSRRAIDSHLTSLPQARDLVDWEHAADAYARESGTVPPERHLQHVLVDLHEVHEALAHPLPDQLRHRALRVASTLSTVAARAVIAAGHPEEGRRWWRTARRAALAAGDRELVAFAEGQQAVLALYGTHTTPQVLRLADEALAAADGLACAGTAQALAARAQALAVLGSRHEALRALAELQRLADRLPDEVTDNAASWCAFPEHALWHTQSYVCTWLGQTTRARTAQEQALAGYAGRKPRNQAQVLLHQARCLVADGDARLGVDHAVATLEPLPAPLRTDRLVQTVACSVLDALPAELTGSEAAVHCRELVTAAA